MKHQSDWLALVLVLIVGLAGVTISVAGWNSKLLDLDALPVVLDALRFLDTGVPPVKGSLLSMGAYSPPLTAWLYIPGVAIFDHPGLFASAGTGALFVTTLVGLYLLGRRQVGIPCALLAVGLFAFSQIGQHFAGFIGNWTFFIVWMLYFASRWVFGQNGRYLAAALLVLSIGFYNNLVIAPALFIFPVLWFLYRPPVTARPLIVAGVIGLAIWSPYLIDQAGQGFGGLIAQLTRTSVFPADFEKSWCDPSLRTTIENQLGGLDLTGQDSGLSMDGPGGFVKWLAIKAAGRLSVVTLALTGNFELSIGGAAASRLVEGLLALCVVAVVIVGVRDDARRWTPGWLKSGRWVSSAWLTAGGIVALAVAAGANEFVAVKFFSRDGHLWPNEIQMIRQFQAVVGAIGLAMVFHTPLGRLARGFNVRTGFEKSDAVSGPFLRFLGFAILVPAVILILVGTPGRPRYFHWLWPMQCMALAVFAIHVLPRLVALRRSGAAFGLLMFAVLSWGSFGKAGAAWARGTYAGEEHALSHAVSYIAETLRGEGRRSAMIGYNVPFAGYQISYNMLDSRYKVGAIGDFLLGYRFGVENTNRCAEGMRPDDEFRVVAPGPRGKTMAAYLEPPAEGFSPVASFGKYRVLRRTARP